MTWNSHGHHIPTSPQTDETPENRPEVIKCGGTHVCKVCHLYFRRYLDSKKESEDASVHDEA